MLPEVVGMKIERFYVAFPQQKTESVANLIDKSVTDAELKLAKAEFCFNVEIMDEEEETDVKKLKWLLSFGFDSSTLSESTIEHTNKDTDIFFEIGPRYYYHTYSVSNIARHVLF